MKKNTLLLIVLGGLIALASFSFPNENDEVEAFVTDYFNRFNAHDWESMASLYSTEARFKSPTLGFGVHQRSHEDIVQEYTELSQIFPDLRDSVVSVYPAGRSHIVVEFISTGTDPSGAGFMLPICTIFKIENGLITEDFTYYDNF